MRADLVERLEEYAPTVARYGLVAPHSRQSLAALLREAAAALRAVESGKAGTIIGTISGDRPGGICRAAVDVTNLDGVNIGQRVRLVPLPPAGEGVA